MADIISIHDYPGSDYSAYWEIMIEIDAITDAICWECKIIDRATNAVLESDTNEAETIEEARFDSQSWALEHMPHYRKEP